MRPISKLRIAMIACVALLSIYLVVPTARYYLHLQTRVEASGLRPDGTERPATDDQATLDSWREKHPELAQWYDSNHDHILWEEKADQLRGKAVPLGLDLLGGADVTLILDRIEAESNEVDSMISSLEREFGLENVSATMEEIKGQAAFHLGIADPANSRVTADLLKQYEGTIQFNPGELESTLRSGRKARINISTPFIDRQFRDMISGAKKGIEERINGLGVVQARISLQSGDRIRVQVPGVKDPDRLIQNMIKPAYLEFRMVHPKNSTLVDAVTGRIPPSANLPVGTEVMPGKLGSFNQETQTVTYREQDFLLSSRAQLGGEHLRSAGVRYDPTDFQNQIKVSLEFNPAGTDLFAEMTTKHANATPKRQMAILLDGIVRSAPSINEPIRSGQAVIEGGFSNEEATELSQILKAGSLPAPLMIEQKNSIGATLGVESILSGVKALIWGALIVTFFMIIYYGMAGVISIIALILNVLIILAIMALSHATLTMSGIGGILLTIGMAVDANVLIYERIREELDAGRPLRQAIGLGFNRAFTVILDSNMTTLMAALILLQFTEGSVKGFALTMSFGLIANLFTGLTVTYTLCALWFGKFGQLSLGKLSVFKNPTIDFIGLRKFSWPLSLIILIGSLVVVSAGGGMKYGVDFAGGVRAEVHFNKDDVSEEAIRTAMLGRGLEDPRVVRILGEGNRYQVEAKLVEDEAGPSLPQTEKKFDEALEVAFAGAFEVKSRAEFGALTSGEFRELAFWVVLLASIAILIYLSVRFEPVFGVAAIIALVHDLTIVVLLATLWKVQITLEVVAALMVLLGFSVNDTIVIFDRVRENSRTVFGKTFRELCNLSMNQSLSRTVVTSGTLLIAVLVLLLIGGEGLKPFAKVVLLGTIVGTYSSCFVATPLVDKWNDHNNNKTLQALAAKKKKKAEGAKPIGRPRKAV
jgi:SecD/SecF fusion protein